MNTRERDRALSRAVHDFVAGVGSRRAVPTLVHVGSPTGEVRTIPDELWYDDGLRADLVERGLCAVDVAEPMVWLTRRGGTCAHDEDHAWQAATLTAGSRLGRMVPFYVVTRRAWTEPRTGEGRTWARIRVAAR